MARSRRCFSSPWIAANASLGMDVIAAERPLRCQREQPREVLVTWLRSFPRHRLFEAGWSAEKELASGTAACHLCHPAQRWPPGLPGQHL